MLGVTFRQLEVFVETVEAGSFRACAERLDVSQVSVSGHIQSLERQFGHKLFERSAGHRAVLTSAGRQIYFLATALLTQMESLVSALNAQSNKRTRNRLVIAAPGYVSFRLAHALAEFSLANSDLQVEIISTNDQLASDMIVNGDADIGFILTLEGDRPPKSDLIGRERLGLCVRPGHPLIGKDEVYPQDLLTFPFVLPPKQDPIRQLIETALSRWGIEGNSIALQSENIRLVQHVLKQSDAVGCLFVDSMQITSGDLVELKSHTPFPKIEIRMIVAKAALPQRARTELKEYLRKVEWSA